MIRALIFDLDDTLYCERDFLVSGFGTVAHLLAARCGGDPVSIHDYMLAKLASEGRRAVFPAVLARFPGSALRLDDLVTIYRGHTPGIQLFAGYPELLTRLRTRYLLGLVTDGNPDVQRSKCQALGLERFLDYMIFTWDYGREREKPHIFPFQLMLNSLAAKASEAVFIGDNVEKDCRGARQAGMRSIRVRKQNEAQVQKGMDADLVIDTLIQLPFALTLLEGQHEAA